ncbi:MAG: chloride channel protein, partial [Notoacmeibacter sp.]|nr:chloride channel protein [Notoacmeibacter sp.]
MELPFPLPITRLPTLIRNWLKPNLDQFVENRQPVLWLLALCVGIGAALLAILFREAIGVFQYLWIGFNGEFLYTVAKSMPAWQVFLGPVVGGLVVGLLLERISTRRTGGVADVIEARAITGRKLSKRDGLWSALITTISLGSGASGGREGPVVHLGATLAMALSERFSLPEWSRRTLLGAGVASAISASFNAPIAGVLFAHEVILGHYSMRALVPIVISSTAGAILSRLWFGDYAAFAVPDMQITSYWEFPAFVLLGITAAV